MKQGCCGNAQPCCVVPPHTVSLAQEVIPSLAKSHEKNVPYYMNLPYTFIIQPYRDESGLYYTGKVLGLDGCMTDGESSAEVLENLREAMEGWIETKLENGYEVPEPITESDASGKFTLRLWGRYRVYRIGVMC